MRVTVCLFARLRDITGSSTMVCNIPDNSTAHGLWNELELKFPALSAYTDTVSTAVNEEYSRMDSKLSEGDEIAFLPPVSGG